MTFAFKKGLNLAIDITTIMNKFVNLTLICTIHFYTMNGQSLNQVVHTSGTSVVSGINVTVFSSGNVDTNSSYCANTFPYHVGKNSISGSGNGEYTFNFSPPADSIGLNFSGVTNLPSMGQELVKLKINGIHYAIPNVGTNNACFEPLAQLTAYGDIAACSGCNLAGWSGTLIIGPINSLAVFDTVLFGVPAGVLFSLFIGNNQSTIIEEKNINQIRCTLSPNPFSDRTTLIFSKGNKPLILSLFNINGQLVRYIPNIKDEQVTIQRGELLSGLYFFILQTEDNITATGKVVIE